MIRNKTTHVCVMSSRTSYERHWYNDPTAVAQNAICIAAFTAFRSDHASFHLTHVRTHMRERGYASLLVDAVKFILGPGVTMIAESPACQTRRAVAFWLKRGFYADPSIYSCQLPQEGAPVPPRSTKITFTYSSSMDVDDQKRHMAKVFKKHGLE